MREPYKAWRIYGKFPSSDWFPYYAIVNNQIALFRTKKVSDEYIAMMRLRGIKSLKLKSQRVEVTIAKIQRTKKGASR